jgi:hypothetical protein
MDGFRTLGEKAYNLSKNGTDSMAALAEDFAVITQYLTNITEREQKKITVAERYDDEIEMMEKLIPDEPEPAPVPVPVSAPAPEPKRTQAFCEGCGKAYTPGNDLFCMGCGKKL